MDQFSREETKSKTLLLGAFSVFLLSDVALTMLTKDFLPGLVRLVLTIALMYFVASGYRWAKWLIIGLCTAAALLGIGLASYFNSVHYGIRATFLTMSIFLLLFSLYLAANRNINSYLDKVRNKRVSSSNESEYER